MRTTKRNGFFRRSEETTTLPPTDDSPSAARDGGRRRRNDARSRDGRQSCHMNYSLSLSLSLSFFWSLLLNEEKIWIKLSLNSLVCSFSLFLSLSSAALLLQIFFLSLLIKKEEIEKFGSFRVVSSQFFFVLFLSLLSSLLSSINNTHTRTL